MIFHTAANEKYYKYFFRNWHRTLKKFNPEAKFSLRYVGDTNDCDVVQYCKNKNIHLDVDPISFDEIVKKYKCDKKEAFGYYALSRWISLPLKNDHVCMTDIDIVQLHPLDSDLNSDLEQNHFISYSRQKTNKTNKMMFLGFNKDLVKVVKDKSISTLNTSPLVWNLDTTVLSWLIEINKYNWKEYIQLYCLDDLNDFTGKVKFGYFSSSSLLHENVLHKHGVESKKVRYDLFLKKYEN